uniref:Uncharacterized protein n=1 Tax=Chrysotila carterae TaxID=13221 RepID=A0A7S4BMP0_CHRCT
MVAMLDSAPHALATAAAAAGMWGSLMREDATPAVLGVLFCVIFFFAYGRNDRAGPLQISLILAMIACSFVLHLSYLPAGVCCFFALMLCGNEQLLPRRPRPPAKQL